MTGPPGEHAGKRREPEAAPEDAGNHARRPLPRRRTGHGCATWEHLGAAWRAASRRVRGRGRAGRAGQRGERGLRRVWGGATGSAGSAPPAGPRGAWCARQPGVALRQSPRGPGLEKGLFSPLREEETGLQGFRDLPRPSEAKELGSSPAPLGFQISRLV